MARTCYPRLIPNLEDHPLLAVSDCLLNTFAATCCLLSSTEVFQPEIKLAYDRVQWGFLISGAELTRFATKVINFLCASTSSWRGKMVAAVKLAEFKLSTRAKCVLGSRWKWFQVGYRVSLDAKAKKKILPLHRKLGPAVQDVTCRFAGSVISDHEFVLSLQ
jgi:hypothetical protein